MYLSTVSLYSTLAILAFVTGAGGELLTYTVLLNKLSGFDIKVTSISYPDVNESMIHI